MTLYVKYSESHTLSVVEYCMHFVIHFLYISLSAFIYSKVPKTKSCLFGDIWVQTCLVKYYLEEKNIVINSFYILIFLQWGHIDSILLLTKIFFHGTRAGLSPHLLCLPNGVFVCLSAIPTVGKSHLFHVCCLFLLYLRPWCVYTVWWTTYICKLG